MRILPLITILFLAVSALYAQDTTKTSAKPVADTTSSKAAIDSVVTYSAADSIVYSISNREMMLYDKADMKYKDFKLNAGQIAINWDTSILTAQGRKDSADKEIGQPVFSDGGETYKGSHVAYDFKSQKGRVNVANTEIDKNYYHGELIKKFAKDVLYVANGRFTTCDLPDPDYYFQSSKMKIVVNNRIVAEPIIFYVDDVPIFALPFGVFPNKSGRRSGIITPSFGESATGGRYLSHFGYFWAINDYADLTTTADWYTRGGYELRSGFRYALRYYFNGNIFGAYSYRYTGEVGDPNRTVSKQWNLQFSHDQTIDPNTRLVANFNMSSANFFRATSIDYGQILQQNLVSDATLFRNWEGSGNSISINIHRDQNLQDGSITLRLPSISFSHTQSYPFRSAEHANASSDQLSWYELIGYSYNGQFLNSISKLANLTGGGFTRSSSYGVQHSISISAAPKAGFITVSPFVSITDKMYNTRTIFNDFASSTGTDSLVSSQEHGFYNMGYFSTGVSASTRLFGIMQPNILGITAFRHTLQPSVTFTYQPDFSKPFWNYYGQYKRVSGTEYPYSYYSNGIFGGAPSGTVTAIGVGINNNFEMKTLSSDTAKTENKYQLLNLGLNFAYNFAADSLRLSELSVNYRTNIAGKIDIGGSGSFNFYKYVPNVGRVNQFLWSEGHLPDMTSFQFSISTSFHGEKKKQESKQQFPEDSVKAERQYDRFYNRVEPPDLSIPWNLNLGFDYGISKSNPYLPSKYASLRFDLGFNLTNNWKIGFTGSYDFIQHQIVVPTVTVYRDLHCWEMFLTWNPIGNYRGFNLELRIKAPQLHDIKITKREDTIVGY